MSAELFVATLRAAGARAEACLNELPILSQPDESPAFEAIKLNPLLLPGVNAFTLAVAAPGPPPGEGDEPACRLQIRKGVVGVDPGPAGTVASHEWTARGGPTPATLTIVHEGSFDAGALAWTAPWHAAVVAPPDPVAIGDVVTRLHAAAAARDVDALLAGIAGRFETLAATLSLDEGAMRDAFRQTWVTAMAQPDWSVAPLSMPPALRSGAGGRLVRVLGASGNAPLVMRAAGRPLALELTMALLGGDWRVVA